MKSIAEIVQEWFRERLANGDLGRHTPAYNQAFAALPDLIARLGGEPPAQADPAAADAPEPAPAEHEPDA